MTELSPSARAVLEAVTWKKYDVPPEGLPAFAEEMAPLLATALRAAADQVVTPEQERLFSEERPWDVELAAIVDVREQILAIANELKSL